MSLGQSLGRRAAHKVDVLKVYVPFSLASGGGGGLNIFLGMARVLLADLNGPKWTFRPKWTILVHFGVANAEIRFGMRSKWTKMVKMTILDHFGPAQLPGSTAATPPVS